MGLFHEKNGVNWKMVMEDFVGEREEELGLMEL